MEPNDSNLIVLDEVDSTNNELRRILVAEQSSLSSQGANPAPKTLLIKALVAHRQTQGKGRLGRSWVSPKGGLYLSLALRVEHPRKLPSLSLVVALGVKKALKECSTKQDILVKWPNDLYGDQGKLAGILIETLTLKSSQQIAIVGIGVNITRSTEEALVHAAYLNDGSDEAFDKAEVAQEVIAYVLSYVSQWCDASCSFSVFKDEYNANLMLKETEVKATDCASGLVVQGVAKGVDEQGYLLVDTGAGEYVRVAGGEVTLRS